MTKEEEIKELTEWVIPHLNNFIPYDTPNYEELLFKEARYMAEVLYEYRTNPEGYKNIVESYSTPIIDIDELPY